ncbi:hypothetical protein PRK78_006640 [Emydomyces testavorans]|uniref:Uncharacterized protein n=1 Tax=Emydomyces testavorans TaxID=2070801 RepID=A0AAF0IKP8_9EURO|nr:hypothetical protein PRK78_006640 [Emydomyces testavorans]
MPASSSKPSASTSTSNASIHRDNIFHIKTLSDARTDNTDSSLSDLSSPTDIALAYLSTTTKLEDLHTSLLHSLSASGWSERVRTLAFELLRSGRCTRFEDLVDNVVHLATTSTTTTTTNDNNDQSPTILGKRKRTKESTTTTTTTTNGIKTEPPTDPDPNSPPPPHKNHLPNGTHPKPNGTAHPTDPNPDPDSDDHHHHHLLLPEFDVRIPPHIVGKGVKFLHDALDEMFTVPADEDDAEAEHDDTDPNHAPPKAKVAKKQ